MKGRRIRNMEMNLCNYCEELKPVDYEGGCGLFFTCKECRIQNRINLEDLGVSY